jgi:uncharacterized protein YkwD
MARTALGGLSIFAALALAALVQVTPAAAAYASMLLPGDPRVMNLIAAEQALVDLTNADRVANGLEPLEVDPDTLDIARQRAESQLGVPSLSHYDANGELAFARLLGDANLGYQLAGENLARASFTDATVVQRIEEALMHSPLHRKNILERTFKRVAIGAATDSSGQITFAEVYRD